MSRIYLPFTHTTSPSRSSIHRRHQQRWSSSESCPVAASKIDNGLNRSKKNSHDCGGRWSSLSWRQQQALQRRAWLHPRWSRVQRDRTSNTRNAYAFESPKSGLGSCPREPLRFCYGPRRGRSPVNCHSVHCGPPSTTVGSVQYNKSVSCLPPQPPPPILNETHASPPSPWRNLGRRRRHPFPSRSRPG